MGMLKPTYTVVSVAGTNGKGSSVTMLDEILRRAGYRVGRYTSPHLIKYNERICVDGNEVSDAELCESFDRIDRARGDISLTYFEFGTLAALDLFRQHNVEIAILEVGLGGRLDAVNILDADAALISSIDLDHQQWLGNTRESIGREKAGIFRNMAPAVCSDPNPPQTIIDCASALGTPLSLAGQDFSYETTENGWDWQSAQNSWLDLPRPMQYCEFQLQNAAGVLMVLENISHEFPVQEDAIRNGLANFRLHGRMQQIPGEIEMILDVAHNRESVQALIKNLQSVPCIGKTHILIGMLKDKTHDMVLSELGRVADSWSVVTLAEERGCDSAQLIQALAELDIRDNIRGYDSVADALAGIRAKAIPGDRIVITGSFLTVGAALRCMN